GEIDAVALAGEGRLLADAARAVRLFAARFASLAFAVAAAEAMCAGRDAAFLVPFAAHGGATPRARVQVGVAEHRAHLLAGLVRGADLVRRAETVAVRLARVAELAM